MISRICVYKDCHNFYYGKDSSGTNNVTVFAFPKDRKRGELWRVLGQVHPKLTQKELFMCSQHFDSKYLATSKNRTILVGEAVPRPYTSEGNDTTSTEDNEEQQDKALPSSSVASTYINSSVEDAAVDEQAPPSTSISRSNQLNFYINQVDDEIDLDSVVMVESTTMSNGAKENSQNDVLLDNNEIEVSIVQPSRKRARLSPKSSRTLELSIDETSTPDEDEQLIDTSAVSVFQIRGEQYVQMSQDYYLHEKRQMMEQIRRYKHILSNIRTQLEPLEDL